MHYCAVFFAAIVTGGALSSCSDNEDIPELPTPKYEADAALYEFNSTASGYRSLELTASGEFVMMPDDYDYYSLSTTKIFQAPQLKSRASYDGIIYGSYTKTGDNTYDLKGYGTLTIESDGKNAYNLTITRNSGSSFTVSAAKKNQLPDSQMTNNLCRTWNFDYFIVRGIVDGKTVIEQKVTQSNRYDDDDYDMIGEWPTSVIFTKAGSYIVFYEDDTLAISTWSWVNQNNGTLAYSWDYDSMDDGGKVKVAFPGGNNMTVTESYTDYDDDFGRITIEEIAYLSARN